MAGSTGNTNTTNLINGISRSGLEDILATPVRAPEGLSAINEKASSGTEIITNNSSSVIYTSSSNEIYTPEAPATVPIIRVVPGTPTFRDNVRTNISGLVTAASGTVLDSADEVYVKNDLQVLTLNGLSPEGSDTLVKDSQENNASMWDVLPILCDVIEPAKPYLPEIVSEIVFGPSPLERTSRDCSGNPVSNLAIIFCPPRDGES